MRSPHVTSLWPHLFTPFTQKMSEVLITRVLHEHFAGSKVCCGGCSRRNSSVRPYLIRTGREVRFFFNEGIPVYRLWPGGGEEPQPEPGGSLREEI